MALAQKQVHKRVKTKDQNTAPHYYSHRIVDKEAGATHWREDSVISKWFSGSWISTYGGMKLEPYSHPAQKSMANGTKTSTQGLNS